MKSDVAALQLKQPRKLSFAQGALLGVILVIATKFCTLPSLLAGAAGSKAVWVAALLTVIDGITAFFCFQTARRGGLPALDLPRGVKIALYAFFTLFFAMKLSAFSREIATYYALSLFENVPVLPVMLLLLTACALLARKGYAALGRMAEIFVWLFAFVFLFVVIFTRSEGDLFNALGMFNPNFSGFGKGVLYGLGWFGDTAVIAFFDLSGADPLPLKPNKTKRRIAFAAALFCFLLVTIFFAVFTSSYGDAAKMTDYAFIKLSAFKANTDELGSADWPVIILWSIVTTLYLTLTLLSGKECLRGLIKSDGDAFPLALLCGATILFSAFFLDEEGDYQSFMKKVASVAALLAIVFSVGVGVFSTVKNKGEQRETSD